MSEEETLCPLPSCYQLLVLLQKSRLLWKWITVGFGGDRARGFLLRSIQPEYLEYPHSLFLFALGIYFLH